MKNRTYIEREKNNKNEFPVCRVAILSTMRFRKSVEVIAGHEGVAGTGTGGTIGEMRGRDSVGGYLCVLYLVLFLLFRAIG